MGLWTLIPDKLDEEKPPSLRGSARSTTAIAFFLVEMGDKTQVATVALGARFHAVLPVGGTTRGCAGHRAGGVPGQGGDRPRA